MLTLTFVPEIAVTEILGTEFESNGLVPAMLSDRLFIPSPSVSAFGSRPTAPYSHSQMSLIPLPFKSTIWAASRPVPHRTRESAIRGERRLSRWLKQLHIERMWANR